MEKCISVKGVGFMGLGAKNAAAAGKSATPLDQILPIFTTMGLWKTEGGAGLLTPGRGLVCLSRGLGFNPGS